MRVLGFVAALLSACFALSAPALAQLDDGSPPDYVAVKTYLDRDAYPPGETARLVIEMKIDPRVHVNTPTPTEDYQFPTSVEWIDTAGLEPTTITWPKGAMKAFEFTEGKKIGVYEGTQRATLGVKIPAGLTPGARTLKGKFKAQGCTHTTCYAPQTDDFELVLRVVAAGEATSAVNEDKFTAIAPAPAGLQPAAGTETEGVAVAEGIQPPPGAGSTPAEVETEAHPDDTGSDSTPPPVESAEVAEAEGGAVPPPHEDPALQCPVDPDKGLSRDTALTWIYLLAFGSGIALAFTPCVLPLVPITIGFFSRQQESGRRPVVPAMLYVLGISLVYSALGTVAALSGGLFGSMLQKPAVVLTICVILFALALSMFGVWDLNLPSFITNRIGGGRAGNAGALMMGGAMGLIAAPCVGPFVVSLLTYVAEMGSRLPTASAALLGGSLFFALSLGMGLPFFLVALGAGSLRPGEWMVTVKKVFGFIIFGVVLWFLRPLIGTVAFQWLLVALLLAAGLYFLMHSRSPQHAGKARVAVATIGVMSLMATLAWGGLVLRSMNAQASSSTVVAFEPYSEDALARAKADRRPVIIDFWAEWCIACKELEHQTFPDERVQPRLREFVLLKADLTDETSSLYKKWKVRGLPTIVFLDSDGEEIPDWRLTAFESPERFARRLECVTAIDVASR
jgi:thiol:disulfide interchange protein DsbD